MPHASREASCCRTRAAQRQVVKVEGGQHPTSLLHFKGPNRDGYHGRRACQLQLLVLLLTHLRLGIVLGGHSSYP